MKKKRSEKSFCDYGEKINKAKSKLNGSKIYRFKGDYRWAKIPIEKYKTDNNMWKDISRQTIIGNKGESVKFHIRYFEIKSGGYSSYEVHKHEHVIICLRGKGECIIGRKRYKIRYLDTIYISPFEPHQLRNPFKEPFGFLCIVNAKRDKPKNISW
jgi:quercetin dioxygenase-like cupin family protein